ncbi:hypothetical protein ACFFRR_004390 [Megaselia abdita]
MDETGAKETMISNLPLLFANGYPTSLDKITEKQLENFIPFMVQCSYGKINIPSHETVEPEWWPEHVNFEKPFGKPHRFQGNWLETMKGIVLRCYSHHQSEFLINFCKDLTVYDHASLRFINNFNSTTSLFERRSNRLLVTFRNENMSYDQPQKTRKCLLQKSNRMSSGMVMKMMDSPSPFEIYLCDNCDAELYSEDAMKEHEKMCASDDDDVIFCDSPTPEAEERPPEPDSASRGGSKKTKSPVKLHTSPSKTVDAQESRQNFLLNFFLRPKDCTETYTELREASKRADDDSVSSAKTSNNSKYNKKKFGAIARRTRGQTSASTLQRCPQIPFSSPAGQFLVKKSKTLFTTEYLNERLDRLERFSAASPLVPGMPRPKYFDRRTNNGSVFITYRKPSTSSASANEPDGTVYERIYKHPRRQFSTKKRDEDLHYLNELLWKQCRPLSVRLKKIDSDFLANHKHLAQLSPPTAAKLLNIKLTRDARKSKWKISPTNSANTSNAEIIVDTIDLCSSDEDDEEERLPRVVQDCKDSNPSKRVCLENNSSFQTVLKKLNPEITLTPIRSDSNVLLETRIEGNFVLSPTSTPPPPPQPVALIPANQLQNQENFDRNKQQPPPQPKRRSDNAVITKQRRTIGSITNNNTANISNSNLSSHTHNQLHNHNTTLPILQFNRIESIDLTL